MSTQLALYGYYNTQVMKREDQQTNWISYISICFRYICISANESEFEYELEGCGIMRRRRYPFLPPISTHTDWLCSWPKGRKENIYTSIHILNQSEKYISTKKKKKMVLQIIINKFQEKRKENFFFP